MAVPQSDITLYFPLLMGMHGAEIADLQKALIAQNGAKLSPDSRFGKKTYLAVAAFQRKHRLSDDGIVGPKTAKALGWTYNGRPWYHLPPKPLSGAHNVITQGMTKLAALLTEDMKNCGAPKDKIDNAVQLFNNETMRAFLERIHYMIEVFEPNKFSVLDKQLRDYRYNTEVINLGKFLTLSNDLYTALTLHYEYLQQISDYLKKHGGNTSNLVDRANRLFFPSVVVPVMNIVNASQTDVMAEAAIQIHFDYVNAAIFTIPPPPPA